MFGYKNRFTVQELFAQHQELFLIDTRGASEYDPAIPNSHSFYIIDLMEKTKKFEEKYHSKLLERQVVLYCSKGDGTELLRKSFSKKYQVMSLEGGMVGYLEFVTHLLAHHPYENPATRDMMAIKLMKKLTNRDTSFAQFRQIADRLLSHSPDPALRQLV
ncbi:MAG: rhodanese-like domain-containing protein [Magnetococcus sp. DMHC-6]